MFVRYISHELRTPLNIISIGLQLLKKELHEYRGKSSVAGPSSIARRHSPDNELEIIDDVSDSCNVARWVLDDLLDYEDFERGAVVLEFQDCDIADLILGSAKPFVIQVWCKMWRSMYIWYPYEGGIQIFSGIYFAIHLYS